MFLAELCPSAFLRHRSYLVNFHFDLCNGKFAHSNADHVFQIESDHNLEPGAILSANSRYRRSAPTARRQPTTKTSAPPSKSPTIWSRRIYGSVITLSVFTMTLYAAKNVKNTNTLALKFRLQMSHPMWIEGGEMDIVHCPTHPNDTHPYPCGC